MNETNETNATNEIPAAHEAAAEPIVETAPAVDETASSEGAGADAPALAGDEAHPTVAEARAMFEENKGLSSIVTDEGILTRDGVLIEVPAAQGE